MSALEIRFAHIDEIRELEELQRRASLVWEEYREQLLAHPDAIELPEAYIRDQRVRVAVLAGRVVGFSCVLPSAPAAAELDGLFVEPDHWRGGVGRALLDDAFACARAHGIRAVEVTANPRAEAFYVRLGFVVIGRAETRFGAANRMRVEI
jgi:GNAT superfamily N-acetyltransferase